MPLEQPQPGPIEQPRPAPIAKGMTVLDLMQAGAPQRFSGYFVAGERPAVIESGSTRDAARWLEALDAMNVPRADVAYVVVTHIHLDHAGGAGTLLEALPNARLVVHPGGARHLVDPSRLIESARTVFGAQLEALWGVPEPVDPARVDTPGDGDILDLGGGHRLRFLDARGHARHQYMILDEGTGMLFSADELGVRYPDLSVAAGDFVLPSTAPNQFDPAEMLASAARLRSLRPEGVLFSHCGRCRLSVDELAARLEEQIPAFVDLLGREPAPVAWETVRERLYDHIRRDLERQGIAWDDTLRERFSLDTLICAQGLAYYHRRRLRQD